MPENFTTYGLSEESLAALDAMGIHTPTSVQDLSLIPGLQGRDVIAKAPTGTGKTFAFGLPMIEACQAEVQGIQGLILAPTRELAQQISVEITGLSSTRPWLTNVCVYGGQNIRVQKDAIARGARLLIATPGRLIDLMKHHRLDLSKVKQVVLDEADRMLDMGFIEDVRYILSRLPKPLQMGMFSATLSRDVLDISWMYQHQPVEVLVEATHVDKPDILQHYLVANGSERIDAICDILKKEAIERALVFVNMKQSAEICARKLRACGHRADALQGDMQQRQRSRVMRAFREGDIDILVGTDVAARGLDIDDVEVVFNYDLPREHENYIHRIGRTGRAKRSGQAFSFIAPGEEAMASFKAMLQKLRQKASAYAWERPKTEVSFLDEKARAAAVARIRKQSSWVREGRRHDPYASERRRPRRKTGGGRSRGRRRSP